MQIRNVCASDEKYSNYRIPGTVVTAAGTLLIYFEARRTAGDWAMMDILLYRSEDGGETFSAPITIAAGTDKFPTVNNPVCIVGRGGVLSFLYCRNYTVGGGDIFCRRSFDDGRSWSEPVNIMAATRPEYHNVFATGPCHGICTREGMLLVPVWMVPKSAGQEPLSHHPAVISTLYSLDNGETWQMGEIIPPTAEVPDPNETAAAQLSDGRIYLNVRSPRVGCRSFTVSGSGTGGWSALTPDRALTDPTCCGSVIAAEYRGRHVLLAVNCADEKIRRNLVCRASLDDGKTWPYSHTVEPGDAGYSDIAVRGEDVFVLYEQRAGERDNLARFAMAEIFGE